MADRKLRIIVAGMAGQYPLGGVAFDYLQYVLGFHRLGHEVVYHEDTWVWPFNPEAGTRVETGDYSADFLRRFFERHEPALAGRWHYQHLHETHFGMAAAAFDAFAASADLFLNVSGASPIPDALRPAATKAFLDSDPGYNQTVYVEKPGWQKDVDRWCDSVDRHDVHFTYALGAGRPTCGMPDTGHRWKTTAAPVVMDVWRPTRDAPRAADAPWTTVMTWTNYESPLVHAGRQYFGKGEGFEKLMPLPGRIDRDAVIAVGSAAPRERLAEHGWRVIDAPQATLTTDAYAGFIADSRGEVSTAKHVYTEMRTGWFSCRTACYLAAGRPAVVEDTGWVGPLPSGEGVLGFRTLDEAVEAIERVDRDYDAHCAAARRFAEHHLAHDVVLPKLLEDAGLDA